MHPPPRTSSANQVEPSPYIYISGLQTARPLSELRHWHARGHYIYDKLKYPVIPACVAGHGPDRLATASPGGHPAWKDTLDQTEVFESEESLKRQIGEVESAERALALEAEEKKLAAEEEEKLEKLERRKEEIKAKTWSGSRGKYGNEAGAKPHSFSGKVIGANLKAAGSGTQTPAQTSTGYKHPPHAYPDQFGPPHIMTPRDMPHQHHSPTLPTRQYSPQYPFPTPTGFALDQMVTPAPAYIQPALPAYGQSSTFDDVVRGMERQVLGFATPRPATAHPLMDDNSCDGGWWAQPAATPTMSVLSPRAANFVPGGIFTPDVRREFATPVAGAVGARPPLSPLEEQPKMNGHHARKRSDLNPMAGAFRPRTVLPGGPHGEDL